jgi:DNA polymerase I-like protein with 3'-5' exonuclease and polymerase domains
MALFKVPERAGRSADSSIAKRANSTKKSSTTVKGGGGLIERINTARALTEKNLGKYRDDYMVIQDIMTLVNYFDKIIENGIMSTDTETTGLDPILDSIVGMSIYTPGKKPAYIPINHISYVTGIKIENQLPVHLIKEQLDRMNEHNTKIIMFNAPFDIRVIRNQIGSQLTCYWDCYVGARLLNENEDSNALKLLHQKYCTDGEGSASKFADLFKDISFALVPVPIAYLYAAHDAKITFELYEFQEPYLNPNSELCVERELEDVAWVFHNIEMPIVGVVADMEDTGVAFDMSLADELHTKYHAEMEKQLQSVYDAVDMYKTEIDDYKLKNPGHKLSDPINLDSPTQVAILLYDIMNVGVIDEKSPRGTGEKILQQIDNAFTRALLEYRGVGKLISTYIDKLPTCVNPRDGRIHCKFNQYGADTGRFSSNDPNLQNIPSHNKDIRKMFKATDGYVLMSSDFSQQEPKALAAMCRKDGDPQMYDVFMAGKDLYSEIASKAFNKPYEECKEFRPDGTTNKEGKERRSQAKSILLGVLYGRGIDSIAEQLKTTPNKARDIKESVFKGFPAIKKFEADSIRMSQEVGFVTTICGRKRRLPSMMLPDYEIVWKDGVPPDDDPLSFDDPGEVSTEVPEHIQRKWLTRIKNAPFFKRRTIFEAANAEGLYIVDNTKDKDTTKVVNARIQGSAADLTKAAMISLHNNERLKELGFRMLIPVHDEIIAECPEENLKECAELLAQTMSDAAAQILDMPINCDVACSYQWYGEEIQI